MNLEHLPQELIAHCDWLTWKYQPQDNGKKPTKKPNVAPGHWDDKKLLTFDEVIADYNRCQLPTNNSRADGIGVAFRRTNNLVGIDFDNITDKSMLPKVKAILTIAKGGGYIERSVSKTGYHVIGECSYKPLLLELIKRFNSGSGTKANDIELYGADRFFTVSGNTVYNSNWTNIDLAIAMAWEYITGKTILQSLAEMFGEQSHKTEIQLQPSLLDNLTDSKKMTQLPPVFPATTARLPKLDNWPANAFTDEEILALPKQPVEVTKSIMLKNKPIINRILEQDGFDASDEYWRLYPSDNPSKDRSASGFDEEIAGVLTFWFYRYGQDFVIRILRDSKLNRNKSPLYWENTVQKAFSRAILFFSATPRLPADQAAKVSAWQTYKKEIAKKKGLIK